MKPRIVELPSFKVAGVGIDCEMDDTSGIMPLWDEFGPRIKEFAANEGVFGVCIPGDDHRNFHYMACVKVPQGAAVPEGLAVRDVPSEHYAVFPFKDKIAEMPKLFDKIYGQYLSEANLKPKMPGISLEDYAEDCWDAETGILTCDLYVALAD